MGRFVGACAPLWLLWLVALGGCEGDIHKDIHGHIHVVVKRDDALVSPAMKALVKHHTRALPQIEVALHTARAEGRVRLLEVLSQVRDVETSALLRHFGVFDSDPRVRALAETTLASWAQSKPSQLATSAQAALRWMSDQRAHGLGPVVREE